MNFNKDLIKKVKILDVIGKYINLKKQGNNYVGLCPFHSDQNPSLHVSVTKNIFKCFSCSVSGDGINFLIKHLNLKYHEALIQALQMSGINQEEYAHLIYQKNQSKPFEKIYQLNQFIADQYIEFLATDKNVLNYLKSVRQIDLNLIKKFKIGYAPKIENNLSVVEQLINKNKTINNSEFTIQDLKTAGLINVVNNHITDFFSERIVFPIINQDDEIIGFAGRIFQDHENVAKYLNSRESDVFKKNQVLYNLNHLYQNNQKYDEIYLVEGYMDVIALTKINIFNVVATMGTNLSDFQINLIEKYFKNQKFKKVILGFDNDLAGKNFSEKVANILLEKGYEVKIIDYSQLINPTNKKLKDIDEIILENDQKNLTLLKTPINYFDWFIKDCKKREWLNIDEAKKICLFALNYFFKINNNQINFKNLVSIEYAKESIENIFLIFDHFNDKRLNKYWNNKKEQYLDALYCEESYVKKSALNQKLSNYNNENFNDFNYLDNQIKKLVINNQFVNSYDPNWSSKEELQIEKTPIKNNSIYYENIIKYGRKIFLYFLNQKKLSLKIIFKNNLDCKFEGIFFQSSEAENYRKIFFTLFYLIKEESFVNIDNQVMWNSFLTDKFIQQEFKNNHEQMTILKSLNYQTNDFEKIQNSIAKKNFEVDFLTNFFNFKFNLLFHEYWCMSEKISQLIKSSNLDPEANYQSITKTNISKKKLFQQIKTIREDSIKISKNLVKTKF
ncbi:DNA primase DnaG [[Mycoplasma] cavipharyngis]|uniref:DNA primase n=1 Tax=[Mycoplasma] cavipharyngis TaxID=92757 RepID=UPI0037041F45